MSETLCSAWATEADLPESCDTAAVKPDTLTQAFQLASSVLYNLSGRRWPGVCETTVRPCRSARGCDRCGYGISIVELPYGPVLDITEVYLDGEIVDPSEYAVRDGRYVVALRKPDGTRRTWPCCQDLSRPLTEDGTFGVTYEYGGLPDSAGVTAAAVLAWEFAVSWTPNYDYECRLPRRVQTITRAGVTMTLVDQMSMFGDGLTGVAEVDMWLSAVRYGQAHGAQFIDPSRGPSATRTTWP